MANIISRPFRFTEHQSYVAPTADEATWTPINPKIKPPEIAPPRISSKFIYVFQRLGSSFQLYAEIFSDEGGKLSVLAGEVARVQARDKRGALVPLGSDVFTLPHTINGKRALYTFMVSRIRLPADSIAAFESKPPKGLIQDIDLAVDDAFLAVAQDGNASSEVQWFLGVTDPATIALNLHEAYERACNQVIFFTMEYQEQPADQRQRVRDRHKCILLAKLLKSVFDNDPSDKLGLENELRSGRGFVGRFIDDYEKTVENLIKERDTTGEALCFFLNGKLLDLIEQSYRFVEQEEYHHWLEIFSGCMERLSECPMGKARLGKLAEAPNHALREYILRTSVSGDLQFAVSRKCNAAIVNLWRELAPAFIIKNKPDVAKRLTDALGNIARVVILEVRVKPVTFAYKKSNGKPRTVTKSVTEVVMTEDVSGTLSRWAKEGKPGKSLERLAMGIEVINLMLAIQSWQSADPQDKSLAGLNAFGSFLDTVTAFNCVLRIRERFIKAVGALSAAIDAFFATLDGLRAYDRDDASSAIGFGAVAFGSVLVFMGCMSAITGLGAGATVVGIPLGLFLEVLGAVLVAAGWLVAVLTGDSDIEQFVSHSKFGVNFPSTSRDPKNKPKWATAPFGDWSNAADGLDHQINSLMQLLASFTMQAVDRSKVRVSLGLIRPDSKLTLSFKTIYNDDIRHVVALLVDLGNHRMSHLFGDPQDMKLFVVSDRDGRTFVEVEATWPKELRPRDARAILRCDCEVLLRLDEQRTVPPDGPFSYFASGISLTGPVLLGPASSYD